MGSERLECVLLRERRLSRIVVTMLLTLLLSTGGLLLVAL
jgi:hypothetical protein